MLEEGAFPMSSINMESGGVMISWSLSWCGQSMNKPEIKILIDQLINAYCSDLLCISRNA